MPRLLVALLPPLGAAALQWLAWPLAAPFPWLLFSPAIFLSAGIAGFAGGMAATALSVVLIQVVFIRPLLSDGTSPLSALTGALILIASGVLFSVFQERLRRAAFVAGAALDAARSSEESLRQSEQLQRDLFEQAPEGIFVSDRNGRYAAINEVGCRMLGYRPEELIGKITEDIVAPEDLGRLAESRARLLAGAVEVGEWTLRRKDGRYIPVEVTAKVLHDGRWNAFVRDISERRRMERELRERDEQLRQAAIVFDSAEEGVVITDPDARIVRVNRAYTKITGYQPEEVVGQNPRVHQSGRHDKAFYEHLWDSLLRTGQWQGEIWNRRRNGEIYPAWASISAVRDEKGRVNHYVALLSDITVIKQSEQRLSHLAHHDTLTRLPNRLLFDARLEQALERAKRHRQRVALLFLDLDRFKLVNDTLGHTAGDQLLQAVAARLREQVRAEDTVARLGGDEFTIIMEELDEPGDAAQLARKLIEVVARPARIEGKEVRTSTSVGIGLYPEDADSPGDLIRAADAAMYRAKMRGRNTFEFFTPDVSPASQAAQRQERQSTERRLH